MNTDIKELYKEPNLLSMVKTRRFRLLEHIQGMNKERGLKKVFDGVQEGRSLSERSRNK